LTSRIEIKGTLITLTQLHIGGAGRESLGDPDIDNQLIRSWNGEKKVPYIPGSSLKGVFRSFIERIAPESCDISDRKSDCQSDVTKQCIACRIFGSQLLSAHLFVSDCFPKTDFSTMIKPGIAINRVTGAAQRHALYTIETLSPQIGFNFEMLIENIDLFEANTKEVTLIKALFRELVAGRIRIGGKVSSGLGQIKLEIDEILYLSKDKIANLDFEYEKKTVDDLLL